MLSHDELDDMQEAFNDPLGDTCCTCTNCASENVLLDARAKLAAVLVPKLIAELRSTLPPLTDSE